MASPAVIICCHPLKCDPPAGLGVTIPHAGICCSVPVTMSCCSLKWGAPSCQTTRSCPRAPCSTERPVHNPMVSTGFWEVPTGSSVPWGGMWPAGSPPRPAVHPAALGTESSGAFPQGSSDRAGCLALPPLQDLSQRRAHGPRAPRQVCHFSSSSCASVTSIAVLVWTLGGEEKGNGNPSSWTQIHSPSSLI